MCVCVCGLLSLLASRIYYQPPTLPPPTTTITTASIHINITSLHTDIYIYIYVYAIVLWVLLVGKFHWLIIVLQSTPR